MFISEYFKIVQNDPLNRRSGKDYQSKTHIVVANEWFLFATAAKIDSW